MAKDYAKFVPSKSNKPKRKVRLAVIFLAFFFFVLIALSSFYLYQRSQKHLAYFDNAKMNAVISDALSLMHYQKNKPKPQSHALENDANFNPEVHFSFYSELPNRKLELAETKDTNEYTVKVKTITTHDAHTQVVPFNPDDISKQMAAELKQQYVVQLGAFEDEKAALTLKLALESVGFKPQLKKYIENNQAIYRLQQGPFSSLKGAKLTQDHLKKRGVISVIKKLG